MKKCGYRIAVAIADLHIGVKWIRAADLKDQLRKHFFEPLESFRSLSGIFILGDVTDTILSLNSEYSNLFYWFIQKVYRLARRRGATVMIIKGTASHDNDQLDNIRSYADNDDGVDFRIYDTIQETTIWDDYRVLVLPDVKVKHTKDVDRLLAEPGRYDMILGHGLIDRMRYFVQESENAPAKTYVYPVEKLIQASRGPVLFGHIHQYQSHRSHFYYVGPFTMLERGELDAGFAVIGICDSDRSRFRVEHYLNPDSAAYVEMNVTDAILSEFSIDEVVGAMDDIIAGGKANDLFTIRISKAALESSPDRVSIIENRYRGDRRISVVKKVVPSASADSGSDRDASRDRYSYCMDESMPLPSILYTYYISDVRPTLPDRAGPLASLVEDDFWRALDMQKTKGRTLNEKDKRSDNDNLPG